MLPASIPANDRVATVNPSLVPCMYPPDTVASVGTPCRFVTVHPSKLPSELNVNTDTNEIGVGVGVRVGVSVGVGVAVLVGVIVAVGVSVGVSVGVGVAVFMAVAVGVAVSTGVGVMVGVDVGTGVDVDVGTGVTVGVLTGVGVGVSTGVGVGSSTWIISDSLTPGASTPSSAVRMIIYVTADDGVKVIREVLLEGCCCPDNCPCELAGETTVHVNV